MRHYLNTTLKGKKDDLGLNYYSVYFMFTVNRQTFKIKSRILNKLVREEQFEQIIQSNNTLLLKDQEIINFCLENSIHNGFIDIDQFKASYSLQCTSIILWYEDLIRNERGKMMDDFFYGGDVEETQPNNLLSDLETEYSIDRRTILNYLNQYSVYRKNQFARYIVFYDWFQQGLRNDFIHCLDSLKIVNNRSKVMSFIDDLISSI